MSLAAKAKRLNVWMGSSLLGQLDHTRSGIRFTYMSDAVEHFGLGIPVVSVSLPTSVRAFSTKACEPFFDGLLPEGESRRIIAYDLGLAGFDTFGLLAALGRDCAGALAIVPESELPTAMPTLSAARSIDQTELARRLRILRTYPLGVDNDVRVSLAGVQEKLLLTRRTDGWGLPVEGSASTHILKPGRPDLRGNVVSEALCLRMARNLAIPAADVSLIKIEDNDVIVVERFDRKIERADEIRRVHQEDACQALGVPVGALPRKYEESGGPSLRQVASVLSRWSSAQDVEMLLRQTVLNVLVGNADAHAMNVSLVHEAPGLVRLSPLYDVFSSLRYSVSPTPGMFINGRKDLRLVAFEDLVVEAVSWGIEEMRANEIARTLYLTAPSAAQAACEETPEAGGPVGDFLIRRVEALAASI